MTPSPLSTSTSFGGPLVSGGFFSIPTTPNAYVSYDAASNVYTLKGIKTSAYGTVAAGPDTPLPPGNPDPTETRNAFHTEPLRVYEDALNYITHKGRSGKIYSYGAVGFHSYVNTYIAPAAPMTTDSEIDLVTFGFPTSSSLIPTSGKRTFVLDGYDPEDYYFNRFVHLASSGWTVRLTVDFGTQTYTLSGTKSLTTEDASWIYLDTGTISSSGSFTRNSNAIRGTLHLDGQRNIMPRPGNTRDSQRESLSVDGPFSATFFGPGAEEIGAAFTAQGTGSFETATTPATTTTKAFRGAFLGGS